MESKVFEVVGPQNDSIITVVVTKLARDGSEGRMLAEAGYHEDFWLMTLMDPSFVTAGILPTAYIAEAWKGHGYGLLYLAQEKIERQWDSLSSGDRVELL